MCWVKRPRKWWNIWWTSCCRNWKNAADRFKSWIYLISTLPFSRIFLHVLRGPSKFVSWGLLRTWSTMRTTPWLNPCCISRPLWISWSQWFQNYQICSQGSAGNSCWSRSPELKTRSQCSKEDSLPYSTHWTRTPLDQSNDFFYYHNRSYSGFWEWHLMTFREYLDVLWESACSNFSRSRNSRISSPGRKSERGLRVDWNKRRKETKERERAEREKRTKDRQAPCLSWGATTKCIYNMCIGA